MATGKALIFYLQYYQKVEHWTSSQRGTEKDPWIRDGIVMARRPSH